MDTFLASTLDPRLVETNRLIELYTSDLKEAKRRVLLSPSSPDFPDSEWAALLSGRACNLDIVFANIHSPVISDHHSHQLGEFTIQYSPPVIGKVIKTHGDWTTSWMKYSAAVIFAFPGRGAELGAYAAHMNGLFSAIVASMHPRVISYDQAVRKYVGTQRTFLLSETERFSHIKFAHIDNMGSAVAAPVSPGSDPHATSILPQMMTPANRPRGEVDVCRRWNAGDCPHKHGKCRFLHVCANCSLSGHNTAACPSAARYAFLAPAMGVAAPSV